MVKSFTGAVALQLCDEGQVGEEDGKGGGGGEASPLVALNLGKRWMGQHVWCSPSLTALQAVRRGGQGDH